MKNPIIGLVLAAFAGMPAALQAAETLALESGDYIAICGDSITEQKIYSDYLEEYFIACQPAPDLQASQFGWGGETAWGLRDRMVNDVLSFKPTVATFCYGMNDGDYSKTKPDRLEQYTSALTEIVRTFKKSGVREMVIGGPGPVDTTSFKGALFRPITAEDYNQTLADFTRAAEGVAKTEGVRFADIHARGMEVMAAMKEKYGDDYLLFGDDGIHPREAGHLVMAHAFLKALGCDGHIGTIDVDMSTGEATADAGHKILSSGKGTVKIESTRYPFCFFGDPSQPNATSGVIEFLPFNEELNRFKLIVRNLPDAGKVNVTWGAETKEYTPRQLAQGINLAAEFLNNPFSGPFREVHEAVLRQQRYETPMMKEVLHGLPNVTNALPEKKALFDSMRASLIKEDEALRQAAVASVKPVVHEIHIGN